MTGFVEVPLTPADTWPILLPPKQRGLLLFIYIDKKVQHGLNEGEWEREPELLRRRGSPRRSGNDNSTSATSAPPRRSALNSSAQKYCIISQFNFRGR